MSTLIESVKSKSNEELLVMVFQIDEWSPEMNKLVENELKYRNIFPIDHAEKINALIETEREELELGKPASLYGKVIACMLIFGLGGIFIGHGYANSKIKSKYSDHFFYKYDKHTREFGNTIYYLSIAATITGLLIKILN